MILSFDDNAQEMKKTLGDYIAQLRLEKGMSQRDLAKKAGFTQGTINKIENGLTAHPGIDVLDGISMALGVPIGNLVAAYQGKDPAVIKSSLSNDDYIEAVEDFLENLPIEKVLKLIEKRKKSKNR